MIESDVGAGELPARDLTRAGPLVEFEKEYHLQYKRDTVIRSMKYLIKYPNHSDSDPVPLVLFLHGSSARGDNFDNVTPFALPKLLVQNRDVSNLNMCAVIPLCPKGIEWKDPILCLLLMALVNDVSASVSNIDTARIYCTGISMGGLGTWMLAARNPTRFAALAPICGGGAPVYARLLAHIPIHFFHSIEDNVVGVEETDRLVAALRTENASEVLYTRYTHSPDPSAKQWMVGHNCWDKAYSDMTFWQWLFSKSLVTTS